MPPCGWPPCLPLLLRSRITWRSLLQTTARWNTRQSLTDGVHTHTLTIHHPPTRLPHSHNLSSLPPDRPSNTLTPGPISTPGGLTEHATTFLDALKHASALLPPGAVPVLYDLATPTPKRAPVMARGARRVARPLNFFCNLNGIYGREADLETVLHAHDISFAALQEPKLVQGVPPDAEVYEVLLQQHTEDGIRGLAWYVDPHGSMQYHVCIPQHQTSASGYALLRMAY